MSFITALPSCVLVLSSGLTTKFNFQEILLWENVYCLDKRPWQLLSV
jgi:hypothetical protein